MDKEVPDLKVDDQQYQQTLGEQVNTVEQEARMVLPGIQTLFGFQLIAVFNQGFRSSLNQTEQIIHLGALLLVSVSAILILAPAAYHRQANHQISLHFISLASSFIAWAMLPLAIGTCADIYLVSLVIVNSSSIAAIITLGLASVFAWTWFVLPRLHAKKVKDMVVNRRPL
jgi:hypothetical protein